MLNYTIEDITMGLKDSDQVYVRIAKEDTEELHRKMHSIPININGEVDFDYEFGELQFVFEKETEDIGELLLMPVYQVQENPGDYANGDFIKLPEHIFDEETMYKDVLAHLKREREIEMGRRCQDMLIKVFEYAINVPSAVDLKTLINITGITEAELEALGYEELVL